jgi:hypothetical protein
VRAANSMRRVQTYIENILDNKFVPDSSHGINYIKHNLEYGSYEILELNASEPIIFETNRKYQQHTYNEKSNQVILIAPQESQTRRRLNS